MCPLPLTWIDVPAGQVTLREYVEIRREKYNTAALQSYGTFDVPAFEISKYPVTNAQFAPFIEAGGYETAQYWTAEGWQHKLQGQWVEPSFWQQTEWNGADYPVVGVSWSEALAYCQWLSTSTDDPVVLPTQGHWHRAAQGDDGR